jgi:hypothetical protein
VPSFGIDDPPLSRDGSLSRSTAIAIAMFGEQAKIEARKARLATQGRPKKLELKKAPISKTPRERKWYEIAAQRTEAFGRVDSHAGRTLGDVISIGNQSPRLERPRGFPCAPY